MEKLKRWQPSFYFTQNQPSSQWEGFKKLFESIRNIMSHCIYLQVQKKLSCWATTAEAQFVGPSWPRDCVSACGSLFGGLGGERDRSGEGIWREAEKAGPAPYAFTSHMDVAAMVARPDPEPNTCPLRPTASHHVSLAWHFLTHHLPCFSPFPQTPGFPLLTLTTLPSDRAAWIMLASWFGYALDPLSDEAGPRPL